MWGCPWRMEWKSVHEYWYRSQLGPFYMLSFPTANATWTFDVTEGAWHERGYWRTTSSTYEAVRVFTHAFAEEIHLVGDRATGRIYRMALDLYRDVDEAAIRRLRQPPRIAFGQKRFTIKSVQIVMDVGIGASGVPTTPGFNPQMMRRASRDGGRTWGPEHWRSAGKIGEYGVRVKWQPCGQARNYVDEFVWSEPIPLRIADAEIELAEGTS